MTEADQSVWDTGGRDDGCWLSDPEVTQIIPEEYYQNRQGDLASTARRDRPSRKRKFSQDKPHVLPEVVVIADTEMEPIPEHTLDNTQRLTQPYFDPRRLGRNNSEVSENDAADVICILHPNSPAAHDAVLATMLAAPQHILQNDDLQDITKDDLLRPEFIPGNMSRDIALRISSSVKNPAAGFVFGRNKGRCDVLLVEDEEDKSVSNMHFRIFLNHQGTLMLQDTSTNGTVVDDDHLRHKDRHGMRNSKPATRMINNGVLVCVVGPKRAEIKFLVRSPKRGDYEAAYHGNLTKYVSAHTKSQVSIAPVSQQHTFGMHWNGGSQYNVVGLLGKGAFATVYRLATTDEGLPYAAKELDKRRFMKNGVLDLKFDNEIKIMKGLRHPNIVQYIDYRDHEQWVYIIMEFVPFGELSRHMQEKGPVKEEQVRIITRQILHALDYLHRRNITHRDIKPDNILIASFDPLIVKLSDFGLSKCVNDEETFLKTFCGTLLYCAPEVYPEYASYQVGEARKRRRLGEPVRRTSPYDQSVDMWSFGAVLFHILCGKAPIMGRGDDKGAQMLNNIMTKDVDFEPLRQRGVSKVAIDFIGRLLNRNPLLRPNENECFQHPWISGLADEIDYMDEDNIPIILQDGLEAVEEAEEEFLDDEEDDTYRAMFGLLQRPPIDAPVVVTDRLDLRYGVKRQRRDWHPETPRPERAPLATEQMVDYPTLPEPEPDDNMPKSSPAARGDRLFGEITPSVLQSSGIFGRAAPAAADVPAIRHAVEQISVNDFVTFEPSEALAGSEETSENQLQYPQALPLPGLPSSAPSLLGAEVQIGMLNMGSPEAGAGTPEAEASEGTSPDTTNPLTPKTREITPTEGGANSNTAEPDPAVPAQASPPRIKFSRKVDLDMLENDAAFEAAVQAREASRIRMRERKANTFHWDTDRERMNTTQMARTMDERTAQEPRAEAGGANAAIHSEGTQPSRRIDLSEPESSYPSAAASGDGFAKPLRRLGKLGALPGSFTNTTIYLTQRTTSWGRNKMCTVEYMDKQDTRVPKAALQITFWAPDMEARIERGEDWTMVPGICTLVSTSTSRCIWVNDVELLAQSKDGDAALYGKIYTGDIITIFKSHDATQGFLKFKVEIGYGDSAKMRPEIEKGFEVRRETQHHKRFVESKKSMNESGKENAGDVVVVQGLSAGTVLSK